MTRQAAARRAGVSCEEVRQRPDLLRIGGRWLEEVYFAFQFDDTGIKRDLGTVVLLLHRNYDDVEIADWLARPNRMLEHLSPLRWSASGRDGKRLDRAAQGAGPVHDDE